LNQTVDRTLLSSKDGILRGAQLELNREPEANGGVCEGGTLCNGAIIHFGRPARYRLLANWYQPWLGVEKFYD